MAEIDVTPDSAHRCHPAFSDPANRRTALPGPVLMFDVEGTPTPQGSKKAFARTNKATGKTTVALVESAGERLKEWRAEIVAAAMVAKVKAGWAPANDVLDCFGSGWVGSGPWFHAFAKHVFWSLSEFDV